MRCGSPGRRLLDQPQLGDSWWFTYRLLGSLAEAEDAVQEAYARWYAMSRPQQDAIASPGAWLTTVADLSALFASTSTIARVPLFLLAILLARGLPALAYLRLLGLSRTVIAGILQATSLPFIVAATQIGLQLGVVSRASAAGLVAAGLLSVVISPALGLVLLRREHPETATPRPLPTPMMPVLTAEDRALRRASDVKPAA